MIKLVLIFIINILLYIKAPVSMDKTYMSTVIGCSAISVIIFMLDKKSVLDRLLHQIYLRHSVFFILCFFIVFYQCDLDYILGIIDADNKYLWYDTSVVCKSLALSSLALSSFLIGYKLYQKPVDSKEKIGFHFQSKVIICHFTLLLLIIYYIFIPKSYLQYGYGTGIETGLVGPIMGYLQACFIAIFLLYSFDFRHNTSKNWFKELRYPLLLISFYILLILLSGRRTEALRSVSLVLISYIYSYLRKVDYKKIILSGILAICIFSVLGVLRAQSSGNFADSFRMISDYQSISPFTREYAGSVNTLHIAVANYPSKYEYNYGTTFLPSFLKIVPGLSNFFQEIVGYQIKTSGDVITETYFDSDPSWGLGTSIIADCYISFGPIGVCIIFLLFGLFLKHMEYITFIKYQSLYILALSFCCYSTLLYMCRSSFSIIFICWAYSCLIILLVKSFAKRIA